MVGVLDGSGLLNNNLVVTTNILPSMVGMYHNLKEGAVGHHIMAVMMVEELLGGSTVFVYLSNVFF